MSMGESRPWCQWVNLGLGVNGSIKALVSIGECRPWCQWVNQGLGVNG